ncbi:MAG TPA: penicillin-binding transpeptidase domain-containing protein [Solirubrobacteraceae bacterium]|nr:penicillin-binding transpeptidase domain-containing protein [Solirubrobacteraceae bacterium]
MIEAPLQRRTPLPPQLTRRVSVLAVVMFVLFGILAFRLWYLQVLTGTQNAARVTANVVQPISLPAPRGAILASDGQVLANWRNATQVAVIKDDLPSGAAQQTSLFKRLGHVLGLPWRKIEQTVNSGSIAPGYAPTPIGYVGEHTLAYLGERKRYYPGVIERSVPVRYYPQGDIGSVVLGTVGQISSKLSDPANPELGTAHFKGVSAGSIVGQSGLEWTYQPYLQGSPGVEKVDVNASGYPTGASTVTAATPGDQLVTSLDLGLEREGYIAVRQAIAAAHLNHNPAVGGSFIAMNPRTGRVLAVGSLPTYNANAFATPISESAYARIRHSTALNDNAIDGLYPTGSTFKPIAALGALKAGIITPQTSMGAGSCVRISTKNFCNSGGADYGDLDLENALTVSEDTYFYRVGAQSNGGDAIQSEARALGLGRSPGIDLTGTPNGGAQGIVPDRAYVNATNKQYWAQFCQGPEGVPGSRPKPRYASNQLAVTGCAQGYFELWTIGQNVLFATGQGFLLATPLQMAIAYSAIFNGGKVWQPQIASQILSPSGALVQQLPAPQFKHVAIDPAAQAVVAAGLHAAAQSPLGTSDAVFGSFPRTVYGKTGTAEHQGAHGLTADQSWYVAYAPDAKRPIVIAVTIPLGGFGAAAAAPAVRLMLSQWFGIKKQFLAGTSPDR